MRPAESPLRNAAVFGLFLAIFSTAWFPVLDADYSVRDDHVDLVTETLNPPWYAIDHESDQGLTPGRAARRLISEGRPLNALLMDLAWRAVSGIEDLRYFRFVGIVGIALLAWSLYRVLVGVGHGRFPSFCVAAIGCSTLPFQIWAHWAIAMTYPFAAALSGVAVLLAEKASSANDHYRPPLLKWLSAGGAGLVLLAALAIYQAAAMFYWVFAAVVVLDSKGGPRELFRRLRWHCAVAAAGLASSFGLVEWGLTLYPTHADRTALVSSLSGKLEWFLHDAAPYALNFVVPSPSRALLPAAGDTAWFESADRVVAWAVFLVVSGGLVLYFRTGGSASAYRFPVAVFLLAASFLPVLAPEINHLRYRVLAAPSCLLVVYASWGVHGLARTLRRGSVATVALGAAALVSLATASHQVRVGLVEPAVRESEFLRRELAACDLSSVQRIDLIGPGPRDTFGPLRQLEFGLPSSQIGPRAMVFLALLETAPAHAQIPIRRVRWNEPVIPRPDSCVVDLRGRGTSPGEAAGGGPGHPGPAGAELRGSTAEEGPVLPARAEPAAVPHPRG